MSRPQNEPIAIIGSGCRFAGGSTNPSRLWELLSKPRDVARRIDRFNAAAFYHPDGAHLGTSNVQESYFLDEDHLRFDAQFFNIQPAEAESIDPQQRILLEAVYEALEAAGQTIEGLQGTDTGVYVGLMNEDYSDVLYRDLDSIPTYMATGVARSIVSNRLSYFFDWHGPSMTIDTACSSSLVAVHQAVLALRNNTSRVAVAAGTNLILGPEMYIGESKLNMLSPTGRSRMWDENADGYARGEGVAAIIIKKLSDALHDGDQIECVIREIGVNQDGRTKGITMPSPVAQKRLIWETYEKAGLDPSNPLDRCQYFEAHGTGTKAGDPVEAEAVSSAFFGPNYKGPQDGILYVGSVKTVIGHTEGTAGLAGILKVSLAMRHKIIPPNLHFNHLNPAIEQFYNHLRIPTAAVKWPTVAAESPLRASINSFGFGGTNAHVIIESYELSKVEGVDQSNQLVTPLVFSAASDRSLIALVEEYASFMEANPQINLRNLAWTLYSRRSALPFKVAFHGDNSATLQSSMKEKLSAMRLESGKTLGIRSGAKSRKILGIFTGQGAQWANMGRELVLTSPYVNNIVENLELALAQLPEAHRPVWSLREQLLADPVKSRISEAAFSQPLCTAIQIIAVDLLTASGVEFSAVTGHSSGEIAAAYAAGFLNASDAIRIAYYRGFYANLAHGLNGQQGSMMAVATSREDATELCEIPELKGRIWLAACNSPSSVTLSGDSDAVDEAVVILAEETKFTKRLKVTTAYHSPHMSACCHPYLEALTACGIKIKTPASTAPIWYSSVYGGQRMEKSQDLHSNYWKDNMLKTVLFSEALEGALTDCGPFDAAIEVGPHPALKGPACQVIADVSDTGIPYTGLLARGRSALESFSEGLGSLWQLFGTAVDLGAYDRLVTGGMEPTLLTDLPSYQWDHERVFWLESRTSRQMRTSKSPVHILLGSKCPDGTEYEMRWRNSLRPKDIPWLEGHQLQGQIIFPAAGYVSMAVEAARTLATADDQIQLLEIQDLEIGRAIGFDNHSSTVEILFSLTDITLDPHDTHRIIANFKCYSHLDKRSDVLSLNASGRVHVLVGSPSTAILPTRPPLPPLNMINVESESFYAALGSLGYDYSGPFKSLSRLTRKIDQAAGYVASPPADPDGDLLVHPAMLDTAFQGIFVGYCHPGDGRLYSLHVPTRIRRIRVNPTLVQSSHTQDGCELPFDSVITEPQSREICGDVTIYANVTADTGLHASIHVEGLTVIPFTTPLPGDDRRMYSELIWGVAEPDGELVVGTQRASPEEIELGELLERIAFYYLRTLYETISPAEAARAQWHHQSFLNFARHTIDRVLNEKHLFARKSWEHDTHDQILDIFKRIPNSVDAKLLQAVGEHLPAVLRGETTILEHMTKENLLDDFYRNGLGLPQASEYISRMAGQIAFLHPHMNILEIGAGTGGATEKILKELGPAFSTYTFTDISAGFFSRGKEVFEQFSSRMTFKTLDIETDVIDQGYIEYSYDMLIASNVLHATRKLEDTMRNARRLLKPGGYLLLLETTNDGNIRLGASMGGLPGWWVGAEDGRLLAPTILSEQWHKLLLSTGFSGIDTITPNNDPLPFPFFVLATQATSANTELIAQPLSASWDNLLIDELLIIGGQSLRTAKVVADILRLLKPYYGHASTVEMMEDLQEVRTGSVILNLADLDEPIFKSMTEKKMSALKTLFDRSRTMLWITRGCRVDDDPFMNMSVGLGRSLSHEYSNICLQYLDLDPSEKCISQLLVEALLRLRLKDNWQRTGSSDIFAARVEPEMAREGGRYVVPRVIHDAVRNDRYNSARRPISRGVTLEQATVSISSQGNRFYFSAELPCTISQDSDVMTIRVSHSILHPIKFADIGHLFLLVGSNIKTGEKVVALAEKHSSRLQLAKNQTIQCAVSLEDEPRFLVRVAYQLLAKRMLTFVPTRGTLLVHEPDTALAKVLLEQAKGLDVCVLLSTEDLKLDGTHWLKLHPHSSHHALALQLQKKRISVFIDFSTTVSVDSLGCRIAACMRTSCRQMGRADFVGKALAVGGTFAVSDGLGDSSAEELKRAVSYCENMSIVFSMEFLEVLHLGDILDVSESKGLLPVVCWSSDAVVPVPVTQIHLQNLFSNSKTYLLIGLTGQLGQSLCQWMVDHGAKYIVLTSRTPHVDSKWIEELSNAGAVVKLFPMDITSKDSLLSVYSQIQQTLPAVGGVINGAMVLEDAMFANMTISNMQKVLRPKVDGTRYLDQLFSGDTLDFFVLFSSIACVMGNRGQSNYTAANMFMTSLARQRRKRGLAASAIDISAIVGIGYISRMVGDKQGNIQKSGALPVSEQDFHQFFAEAVLAGRPDSVSNPEIITGLRSIRDGDEHQVPWRDNPIFSHLIIDQEMAGIDAGGKKAVVLIKTELLLVESMQEAYEVLAASFSTKLQTTLQLPAEETINMHSTMIQLGVDSLVAVEIRTWFLKELSIDMPVLKVLGGTSIADLLLDALERIPANLVPNMKRGPVKVNFISASEKNDSAKVTLLKTSVPDSSTVPDRASPMLLSSEMFKDRRINFETSRSIDLIEGGVVGPLLGDDLDKKSALLSASNSDSVESQSYTSSDNGWTPKFSETNSDSDSSTVPCDFSGNQPMRRPAILATHRMSYGQARLWFLRSYVSDQTAFNIAASVRVEGNLRVTDLERAIDIVGQRHESLRTCFFTDPESGDPMQGVLETSQISFGRKDISDKADADAEFSRMEFDSFDIENGQTMKIMLLTLSSELHYLLIACHHIAIDEVGFQIFMSDLEAAYKKGPFLFSTMLQYPQFSTRQRMRIESGQMDLDLSFWKNRFPDFPDPLPMFPFRLNATRPSSLGYDINKMDAKITSETVTRIKAVCRRFKTTNFHFYVAVFRVLLYRFLGSEDLAIGMADANRTDEDIMGSIGFFVNLLPLRFRTTPGDPFMKALQDARNETFSALKHSGIPFDVILDHCRVPRSSEHSPLFQAFIDYRLGVQEKKTFANCQMERDRFIFGRTAYDVSLDVIENVGEHTSISMILQKDLYTTSQAKILVDAYVNLVEAFSRNPALLVEEPALYNEEDIAMAIKAGKGLVMKSTWPSTLVHRVDHYVKLCGHKTAIKDGDGTVLTYKEMSHRVESISSALCEAGVSIGSRVVVLQEPLADWICSLLAVMRLGAVYAPLDQRLPVRRLEVIVSDCQPAVILAGPSTMEIARALTLPRMRILNVSDIKQNNAELSQIFCKAESSAVILYTSGTTGAPKGIVLTHSNLLNEIEAFTHEFNIGAEVVLQQSAPSFDYSIEQIFTALGNGGTLYIMPLSKRGDPLETTKLIAREGITLTGATPSEYLSWIQYGSLDDLRNSKWQLAASGGEQFSFALVRAFKELGKSELRVLNHYGPTEVTVASNGIEIKYNHLQEGSNAEARVPVGRALPNCATYIMSEHLQALPIGIPGEVVIGGAGIASEYLNNRPLTEKNFILDPFSQVGNQSRIYRTGDRGVLGPDGCLTVLGRIEGDNQVKLRGLRIEFEDIEHAIIEAAYGILAKAVVSVRGDPQFLVAHVVFSSNLPELFEQKSFLRTLPTKLPLPQYMHPAMIVPVDDLPINTHGKMDRRAIKALPLLERISPYESSADLTESEIKLRAIWRQVLPNEGSRHLDINSNTDFFAAGGNSLLLMRLQSLIHKAWDASLTLQQLFQASTLQSMATLVYHGIISTKEYDWESETAISSDLLSLGNARVASYPSQQPKVVVLTGSTGFLGKAILQSLQSDSRITKIHCIAVRPKHIASGLNNNGKAIIHEGDLTLPVLGLSRAESTSIFNEADAIIHNGADVSFMKTFQSLRSANLASTKELAKLALPRRIPIHYISTVGVSRLSEERSDFHEVSVGSCHPPDANDGYTASKWASERFLERFSKEFALAVYIHRPSSITGEGAPETDIIENLMRYSRIMKVVPVSSAWEGFMDFISDKKVAAGVMKELMGSTSPTATQPPPTVSYVHHCGETVVPLEEMQTFLQQEDGTGKGFQALSLEDWTRCAVKEGMDSLVAAFLSTIDTATKPFYYRRIMKSKKSSGM